MAEPLTQADRPDAVLSVRHGRAVLSNVGVHMLRHTFCSHLAMRGAPATAIQELAGHKDLSMTQRYMHLSPAALDDAIRLLDPPTAWRRSWRHGGDGRQCRSREGQWIERLKWR